MVTSLVPAGLVLRSTRCSSEASTLDPFFGKRDVVEEVDSAPWVRLNLRVRVRRSIVLPCLSVSTVVRRKCKGSW